MRRVLWALAACLLAVGQACGSDAENAAADATGVTAEPGQHSEAITPRAEPSIVPAPSSGPQQVLFLSGADAWFNGAFGHAGLLWSPEGLTQSGFTFKLLGGAGTYLYTSHGERVRGVMMLGSAMPGWRLKNEAIEITAYVGLDVQDHRLSPDDFGNRLRGTHFGVRAGADLWAEPWTGAMLAANVSVSSIGPGYWSRVATGWRAFDAVWLGPEVLALGDTTYRQLRFGAHVTSFRTGELEWSAGGGYAFDSDRKSGLYGRIGVLLRR